jgi:hypothetical protein
LSEQLRELGMSDADIAAIKAVELQKEAEKTGYPRRQQKADEFTADAFKPCGLVERLRDKP